MYARKTKSTYPRVVYRVYGLLAAGRSSRRIVNAIYVSRICVNVGAFGIKHRGKTVWGGVSSRCSYINHVGHYYDVR